ncbi:MAG: hypothetical protein WKF41_04165 [Gaiellaceae bacterium]
MTSGSGLNIVVATAPAGLTLEEEIRLAKPALLYGDHVTLYSPAAMMLASAEQVAALDDDGLAEFLRLASDAIPGAEQLADVYEQLRDKRRRSRAELQQLLGIKRLLREMAFDLQGTVVPMLEKAGATELVPAIEAGLLGIDPLLSEFSDDEDALISAFVEKLRDLLVGRAAYPLFDAQVGSLVRAGVDEGMFEVGATARRRGKNVGIASDLIARVPAFPEATIAEILDIREELRGPLGRFRGAVSGFAARVETAAHEEDFTAEVADLYLAEIAPVVDEIREAVKTNAYLRQLTGKARSSVDELLALGGGVTLGLMGLTDTAAVASVVVGAGAAAARVAVVAATERVDRSAAIERDRLFFLYATERAVGQ